MSAARCRVRPPIFEPIRSCVCRRHTSTLKGRIPPNLSNRKPDKRFNMCWSVRCPTLWRCFGRKSLDGPELRQKSELDCRARNPSWPARPWPWNPSSPQAGVVLHTPVRQHSDQRGLDSKCIQSEQLQDHAANRLDETPRNKARRQTVNSPSSNAKLPIIPLERLKNSRLWETAAGLVSSLQCVTEVRCKVTMSPRQATALGNLKSRT
jgi:hypothetical protein